MCRDQNLIEGDERVSVGWLVTPSKRMKIEKPGVGRPLVLGPAKIQLCQNGSILVFKKMRHVCGWSNFEGN